MARAERRTAATEVAIQKREYEVSEIVKTLGTNFNARQMQVFFAPTPKSKIMHREGAKGMKFAHVNHDYVTQVLNSLFGVDGWSFEILNSMKEQVECLKLTGEVIAHGRLTVRVGDATFSREQFAGAKPNKNKTTGEYLSISDNFKGAASLCKVKCARELGLFNDVYNQTNFVNITIKEEEELDDVL